MTRTVNNGVMEAFAGLLDALVVDSLSRVAKPAGGKGGNTKGLLNRKDAAAYLDVSVPTIDNLLKIGEIKAVVIPGTTARRYTRRSLDNLIERQTKKKAANGVNRQATRQAFLGTVQAPQRPPANRKAR